MKSVISHAFAALMARGARSASGRLQPVAPAALSSASQPARRGAD
jgi:hypothetical protein